MFLLLTYKQIWAIVIGSFFLIAWLLVILDTWVASRKRRMSMRYKGEALERKKTAKIVKLDKFEMESFHVMEDQNN